MIPLFLDIETVPEFKTYAELPELGKEAFNKKFRREIEKLFLPVDQKEVAKVLEVEMEKIYTANASFHAEFARIVCVSVGSFIAAVPKDNKPEFIFIKGLIGTEAEIFEQLFVILDKQRPDILVAHNGKAFDYPFIGKRLMINGYPLPPILNIIGKKPWEVNLDDTMEMWRFTDLKSYTSLITLCYCLKIESSKGDLDGSKVKDAFFDGKIEDIKKYCNLDVLALIRVWRRLKYLAPIEKVQMV